jgi:hypothetical protein
MSTRKESETSKINALTKRREDIYLVSGDSWEREFDETDLPTPKTNTTSSNHSVLPTTVLNKDDDEWESWS